MKTKFFILACLCLLFCFEECTYATNIEEAIELCENFIAFEESQNQLHLKYTSHLSTESEQVVIQPTGIHWARELLGIVLSFKQKTINKNSLLICLLQKRFDYLYQRMENCKEWTGAQQLSCGKRLVYLSTYPSEILVYQDLKELLNIENIKTQITRYQFFNRLIRIALYLDSGERLSLKTMQLLNCSITIRSYLLRETDNSGFPDYAIYAENSEVPPHITDMELWTKYFIPLCSIKIPINTCVCSSSEKMRQLITIFELQDPQSITGRRFDVTIEDTNQREVFERLMFLSLTNIDWNEVVDRAQSHASPTDASALSSVTADLLPPYASTSQAALTTGCLAAVSPTTAPSASFTSDSTSVTGATSKIISDLFAIEPDHTEDGSTKDDLVSAAPAPSSLPVDDLTSTVSTTTDLASSATSTSTQPVVYAVHIAPSIVKKHVATDSVTEDLSRLYVMCGKLDGKSTEFLKTLFSKTPPHVIRARDFKHAWEQIGGTMSNVSRTGGSHVELQINRKTVGGIFISKEYSIEYFKYLRAPFISAGITLEIVKKLR